MGKRRTVEIRSAQELKSATGRMHQAKGAAMRDLKMLEQINGRSVRKGGKKAEKPAPPRPGGIRMGD